MIETDIITGMVESRIGQALILVIPLDFVYLE